MTFGEKMKDLLGQGVRSSKDFMVKAGAKAQDLGEKGVLKLEIKQLEGQAQKLICRLGSEVYVSFTDKGIPSVSSDDPVIKGILTEIAGIKENIEKKEFELKSNSQ